MEQTTNETKLAGAASAVDQSVSKDAWRKPTEDDKQREKCRARSPFEPRPFYVQWNSEYNCWAQYGSPHILIAVSEILSPGNAANQRCSVAESD